MKKNIIAIAAAAFLAFGMTACEPESIDPVQNPTNQIVNPRVKTTADLDNTSWSYTTTLAELIANVMPGADTCYLGGMGDENYVFGLTFDGQYAHFSFPENVVALGGEEGMMEQITAVSYEYEYDGAFHTGHLTVAAEDMDGEETIAPPGVHLRRRYRRHHLQPEPDQHRGRDSRHPHPQLRPQRIIGYHHKLIRPAVIGGLFFMAL